MNHTLNHQEKFESMESAYLIGFMQLFMNLAVEFYSILSLLSAKSN